mmetsp:Transcript_11869/g.29985  ORF Transcript_11869/g.29985 Transcript_11869/m.29985 type:complete len:236 (+) Transcript_11869:407-1114(+)
MAPKLAFDAARISGVHPALSLRLMSCGVSASASFSPAMLFSLTVMWKGVSARALVSSSSILDVGVLLCICLICDTQFSFSSSDEVTRTYFFLSALFTTQNDALTLLKGSVMPWKTESFTLSSASLFSRISALGVIFLPNTFEVTLDVDAMNTASLKRYTERRDVFDPPFFTVTSFTLPSMMKERVGVTSLNLLRSSSVILFWISTMIAWFSMMRFFSLTSRTISSIFSKHFWRSL